MLFAIECERQQAEVARQKILQHHFLNNVDINTQAFVDTDTKVLPRAIAWIGMDITGQSLLYKLIHSMPSLLEFE